MKNNWVSQRAEGAHGGWQVSKSHCEEVMFELKSELEEPVNCWNKRICC